MRERDERKEREKEREQEKKREEKERKKKREREREKSRAREKERERNREKEKEKEKKKEREEEKKARERRERERAREKINEKEKYDRRIRGIRKEKETREKSDFKRKQGEPQGDKPKRRKMDPKLGIEDIDMFPSASLHFSTPYSLDISSFPSPQDREPADLGSSRGVSALDYVVKEGPAKPNVEVPQNIQAEDFVNASGVRGVLICHRSDKRPRVARSVSWDSSVPEPVTDGESAFKPPSLSPYPSGFSSHPTPLSPRLSPEQSLSLSLLENPQPLDVNSHSPSPIFPSSSVGASATVVSLPSSVDSSSSVDLSRIDGFESASSPSQAPKANSVTIAKSQSIAPSVSPPQKREQGLKNSFRQRAFSPQTRPPTTKELLDTLPSFSLPPVLYEEPFYERDETEGTPAEGGKVVIGCMEYEVEVKGMDRLPDFWEKFVAFSLFLFLFPFSFSHFLIFSFSHFLIFSFSHFLIFSFSSSSPF